MKTNKTFLIRKKGFFEDTHFYKNIIDISIKDEGEFMRFKFSRYFWGRIRIYDVYFRKSELLLYGIRTSEEKNKYKLMEEIK